MFKSGGTCHARIGKIRQWARRRAPRNDRNGPLIDTESGKYAIRAVARIAAQAAAGRDLSSAAQIAEAEGIPPFYMSKVLKKLASAGVLESVRGRGGGFRLRRPASEIPVLEVLEAVENIRLFKEDCVLGLAECNAETPCPLHDTWSSFRNTFLERIRQLTVDDLRRELARKRADRSTTARDLVSNQQAHDRALPPVQPASRHGAPAPEPSHGRYFVAAYPPFSEWTAAAIDLYAAALGRPPLPSADPAPPLGLYVHIPFCVERCRYCYYLSYDREEADSIDAYLDGLISELERYRTFAGVRSRPLEVVYFGGGTPSLLSTARLRRLFDRLHGAIPWRSSREVSFECAPKSVTRDKARLLREAGVTRLSLGVQQLDDEVLRRNGRVHLVADVEAAYAAIRDIGFDVVNVDLMVGLVGETASSFHRSLDRVIELAPDSVTIYQLEIPFNTPLYRDIQVGTESEPLSWAGKHARFLEGFDRLEGAGYQPISAYTLVRDPARHGFMYQREQYRGADLLGIGASAFSFFQGIHQQNVATLGSYLELVEAGRLPLGRAYALDPEEQMVREFGLQLKLGTISRRYFGDKFGADPVDRFGVELRDLAALGWLTWDEETLRLTREGLSRVDRMIPRLYLPHHRDVRDS